MLKKAAKIAVFLILMVTMVGATSSAPNFGYRGHGASSSW